MKNVLLKILSLTVVTAFLFTACKKDEARIVYLGGSSPALSSSIASGDTLPLISADSSNTAITFSWTNPDYQFSDGISSLNVTYYLQVDTAGGNFSSSHMQTVAITSSLDTSFTTTQFNALLGNGLQVSFNQTHTIQVRIEAFLTPLNSPTLANQTVLYSNVNSYLVTPYAPPPKVTPPAAGSTLALVGGDPLIGAWSNPVPASQVFTEVSPTDYQLVATLSGGDPTNSNASDQYLIVPQNGSWAHKYACANTSTQPFSGGSFGLDLSSNFPGPTQAGTYLFDLNFQTGLLTVTKQ